MLPDMCNSFHIKATISSDNLHFTTIFCIFVFIHFRIAKCMSKLMLLTLIQRDRRSSEHERLRMFIIYQTIIFTAMHNAQHLLFNNGHILFRSRNYTS